jgi:uncharacterized membrane protein
MTKQIFLCLLCMLGFTVLFGHEGHKSMEESKTQQESITPSSGQPTVKHFGGRPLTWTQWIGSFHFIFLHFPIALITMTAISELLFSWFQRPIFDYASRYTLIAAAFFSVPTALLGLTYSYTASYSGILADFMWWHMWAGISTAILAIFVTFLRERLGRSKIYYTSLFLLFLLVNITGYLGGGMTFGPYHMHPPL